MNTELTSDRPQTIQDQEEALGRLRFRVETLTQSRINELVFQIRQSYLKWDFSRSIINWLTRGKYCKHNYFSWTYEILEDAKKHRDYIEIDSFRKFNLSYIKSMEDAIRQMAPEAPANEKIGNSIRIIESQLDR